ncbi:MAG: site-specific DNA-methyltransferase [Deltaproteobacteria bacterium]|nr:site-specific DNA-methyltransferase [Deltaproteobacteria bacterium]
MKTAETFPSVSLIEDPAHSYRSSHPSFSSDCYDNRLICGDNLPALSALTTEFTGKIKCVYIDPPYNTGNAFVHYRDGLRHERWIEMMRPRLQLLWSLLRDDGFLTVQIDDNEFARLYLLMMEICQERNLKVIVVKMAEPTGVKMSQVVKRGGIARLKEYLILAGKSGIHGLQLERIAKGAWDAEYRTVIDNVSRAEVALLKDIIANKQRTPALVQQADALCAQFVFLAAEEVYQREHTGTPTETWLQENAWRIVRTCATTALAKRLADQKKTSLRSYAAAFTIETPQHNLYVIKRDYNARMAQPRIRLLFADDYLTVHPGDFWQDIKTTGLGDEGGVDFTNGKKPEALLKRVIGMATQPGDWVLDAFAGSGTTGAVAHKMRRQWIMIESGKHCQTHILPRLRRVVDGKDSGGVSRIVGWTSGGGFRYYAVKNVGNRREKE